MAAHGTPTNGENVPRIEAAPVVERSFPAIECHVDAILVNCTLITN